MAVYYVTLKCPEQNTIGNITRTNVICSDLDHTHFSLYCSFGSQTHTIIERREILGHERRAGIGVIIEWTIPPSFHNEIPNNTYGIAYLYADIYSNSTFLGTVGTELNLTANPYTSTPTISLPQIRPIDDLTLRLTGMTDRAIRYVSSVSVTINAEAKYGATIDETRIKLTSGTDVYYGSQVVIHEIALPSFTVEAYDSRDLSTQIGIGFPTGKFIFYSKPTCNIGNEYPDTSGAMRLTCSGNFFNASFGAVKNSLLKVEYRYKEQGGNFSEWAQMTFTTSESTYSAYADIAGLDYQTQYIFECRATDEALTVTSAEKRTIALPVFHWSKDNFVFEVPVTFNAGASGMEDGNVAVEAGQWTPTLTTSAAVSSYSTRKGWYIRCGKVVTIGFNIGASCKSGYNSTALAISGLPFTPAYNAFGGGVMFGAYVNAGFCFEAWTAATNGQITPRLQPCNNTSAANLQISSTAYYPSGASTVTLGGTITYLIN